MSESALTESEKLGVAMDTINQATEVLAASVIETEDGPRDPKEVAFDLLIVSGAILDDDCHDLDEIVGDIDYLREQEIKRRRQSDEG